MHDIDPASNVDAGGRTVPLQPKKLLPDWNLQRVVAFVIFIVPVTFAINFASNGELSLALASIGVMVGLVGFIFLVELLLNRVSYYPWYVSRTLPLLSLCVGLLIASSYGVSRYFDQGLTVSYNGSTLNNGPYLVLCLSAALIAVYAMRRTIHKLAPLTFKRPIQPHVAMLDSSHLTGTTGSVIGRSWRDSARVANEWFSLRVKVGPHVGPLRIIFVALERLDVDGGPTGLVWVSERLAFLRPLAVIVDGERGQDVVLNATGRLRRLVVSGGEIRIRLALASDERTNWFDPGSRFRIVLYTQHDGYLESTLVIGGQQ